MATPVFILSLPRSGSTLLQRLLAAHESIATIPEPWILLPQVYALRAHGVYSEYGHKAASIAVNQFLQHLELSRREYLSKISNCIFEMYSRRFSEARYLIDKTPRYHLIIRELIESIENARFIFLWRMPLGIASSMIRVGRKRSWNLHEYKVDLYQGIENMVSAYSDYSQNNQNIISVNYEKLVNNPKSELNRLHAFLGISDGNKNVLKVSEPFNSRLGDPSANQQVTEIRDSGTDKWKSTLNNPLRLIWAYRYIDWIGSERLSIMGYDYSEIKAEIKAIQIQPSNIIKDMFGIAKGVLSNTFEIGIFRDKLDRSAYLRVPHR